MRRPRTAGQMTLAVGGAVLAVLVASIGIRAQQAPGGGGAAARPPIPMAASSVALNPEAHFGENVAMTATVEQALTKNLLAGEIAIQDAHQIGQTQCWRFGGRGLASCG